MLTLSLVRLQVLAFALVFALVRTHALVITCGPIQFIFELRLYFIFFNGANH